MSVVSCERGPGRVCGVARLPGLSSRIGLRRQLSGMFYLKHNEKTRFGYFANDRDCQGDLDVCDRLLMLSNYIILTLPEAQRNPTATSRLYSAPPAFGSRALAHDVTCTTPSRLLFLMLLLLPPQVSLSDRLRNFQGRSLSNDIPVSFGLSRSTSLISRLFPYCQGATLTNPVANEV